MDPSKSIPAAARPRHPRHRRARGDGAGPARPLRAAALRRPRPHRRLAAARLRPDHDGAFDRRDDARGARRRARANGARDRHRLRLRHRAPRPDRLPRDHGRALRGARRGGADPARHRRARGGDPNGRRRRARARHRRAALPAHSRQRRGAGHLECRRRAPRPGRPPRRRPRHRRLSAADPDRPRRRRRARPGARRSAAARDAPRDAGRRRRGARRLKKRAPSSSGQRLLNLNALLMWLRWVSCVVGCSMRNFRTLSRFALIGVVGGLSGACSETARLNPFPDLFGSSARTSSEPPMTGSVSRDNSGSVQSRPLAPPAAAPAYNRPAAAAPAPNAVPAAPPPVATGPGGWTAQGGTAVSVKPGESLNTLASRYNVPPAAILSANNLKNAAQVAPGKRIVIPVYSVGAAAPARPAAAKAAEPKPQLVQGPKGQAKPAEPQKQAAKPAEPQKQAAKPEPQKQAAKPEPQKQVAQKAAPQAIQPGQKETAKAETQVPKGEIAQTGSIAPQAAAPAPAPAIGFRWPAKGRVIAGFGGTSANEGINIALPEGTPVKAAEDGTVAYAGSDVKGYGKLVLIRHDNGYVSAYAHNGEIAVKHGEKVKRGQAIAKSGQSGNVTSPQLHFEIRKGAQPVDPMPHLQGG